MEPASLSPGPAVGPIKHAGPAPRLRLTEAERWEAEALWFSPYKDNLGQFFVPTNQLVQRT